MEMDLTIQELLTLLSFSSHILEDFGSVQAGFMETGLPVELAQVQALGTEVQKILARIDKENPNLISMPKDGVPWRDR